MVVLDSFALAKLRIMGNLVCDMWCVVFGGRVIPAWGHASPNAITRKGFRRGHGWEDDQFVYSPRKPAGNGMQYRLQLRQVLLYRRRRYCRAPAAAAVVVVVLVDE